MPPRGPRMVPRWSANSGPGPLLRPPPPQLDRVSFRGPDELVGREVFVERLHQRSESIPGHFVTTCRANRGQSARVLQLVPPIVLALALLPAADAVDRAQRAVIKDRQQTTPETTWSGSKLARLRSL